MTTKKRTTKKTVHLTSEDYKQLLIAFDRRLCDTTSRVFQLEQQVSALADKPRTTEYVLTEADWKRVIEGKYLVEWNDGNVWRGPHLLRTPLETKEAYSKYRLYTGPHVFVPYFGQGRPAPANTRVCVLFRYGQYRCTRADALDWNHKNDSNDIMEYMILEGGV